MKLNVNGFETFVDDHGRGIDPALPTVLWIPGAGMEAHVFALQSRHFAFNGWNSLGITRPGHGVGARHSAGPNNQTVEAEADWLVALLDALGVETAAVVGHSLGGLIALDFAARYPSRTTKLLLMSSAPAIPVHPSLIDSAAANLDAADDMIAGWGFGTRGHQGGNRASGSWMMGGARRLLGDQPDGILHADLVMCNAYTDGEVRCADVAAPTLAYLAAQDRMTPVKVGKQFGTLIADCQVQIHPNSGHMVQVEQPDDTLKATKAFLNG